MVANVFPDRQKVARLRVNFQSSVCSFHWPPPYIRERTWAIDFPGVHAFNKGLPENRIMG